MKQNSASFEKKSKEKATQELNQELKSCQKDNGELIPQIIAKIREIGIEKGITFYNEISFKLDFEKDPMVGGVYGFVINLKDTPINVFLRSLKKKNEKNKLIHLAKKAKKTKPIIEGVFPLYWGIDKYIFSRYFFHMTKKGLSKTANIHLRMIKNILKDYDVYFISFFVSDNVAMEKILQEAYPNILKTLKR